LTEYTVTFEEQISREDVEIKVYDDTDTLEDTLSTDSDGEADIDLEDGVYWFIATKGGYSSVEEDFEVDGDSETIEFELIRLFTDRSSLDFDGSDDYVDIGDNNIDLGNSGTVILWAHPRMEEGDTRGNLFEGGYSDGDRLYAFMYPDSEFEVGLGESGNIGTGWYPEMDKLYYFVLVWDGGEFEVYANNEKVGDGIYGGEVSTDQGNWYIGNSYFGDYYFEGLIYDVRIYDRALSESEINEIYQNRYKELGDEVAHWKMDDGHGDTVTDYAGDNDGTRVGATWRYRPRERCLSFDGVDDYVDIDNTEDLTDYNFTVSFWLNTDDTRGIRGILTKGEWSHSGWEITTADGEDFRFVTYPSITYTNVDMPMEQWNHWVVIVEGDSDGVTSNVYLNGEHKDTTVSEDDIDVPYDILLMSRRHRDDRRFSGLLDDVRIYDRALSEDERKALMRGYDIRDGLVGYWALDDESDPTTDYSGNENHGDVVGATWSALHDYNHRFLYFDGSDDKIRIGTITSDNPLMLDGSDATFSFWGKREDSTGNNWQRGIDRSSGGQGEDGYALYIQPDETGALRFDIDNATADFDNPFENDGEWHHVVAVLEDGDRKIYYDGDLVGSQDGTASIPDVETDLYIAGWDHGDTRNWNGEKDDVRIYDRALSSDEIEDLYNGANITDGLVLHLPMYEGKGETVYDRAYDNDGDIVGATWVGRKIVDALSFLNPFNTSTDRAISLARTVTSNLKTFNTLSDRARSLGRTVTSNLKNFNSFGQRVKKVYRQATSHLEGFTSSTDRKISLMRTVTSNLRSFKFTASRFVQNFRGVTSKLAKFKSDAISIFKFLTEIIRPTIARLKRPERYARLDRPERYARLDRPERYVRIDIKETEE